MARPRTRARIPLHAGICARGTLKSPHRESRPRGPATTGDAPCATARARRCCIGRAASRCGPCCPCLRAPRSACVESRHPLPAAAALPSGASLCHRQGVPDRRWGLPSHPAMRSPLRATRPTAAEPASLVARTPTTRVDRHPTRCDRGTEAQPMPACGWRPQPSVPSQANSRTAQPRSHPSREGGARRGSGRRREPNRHTAARFISCSACTECVPEPGRATGSPSTEEQVVRSEVCGVCRLSYDCS